MANFVKNIVRFYGNKDELEKLVTFFKQGNRKELDFNLVVPEPKDLANAVAPYDSKGLLVGEYLITGKLEENLGHNKDWYDKVKESMSQILERHFESDKELVEAYISVLARGNESQKEKYLTMYKTWYNNWKQYGYPDWFDWRVKHWGTKWNACHSDSLDTLILKEGYVKGSYSLQYTFETAWNMPEPFFLALSKVFPEITVEVQYANEDIGADVGMMSFEGGEILDDERYECYSRDAMEEALCIWGDDDQIPYLVSDEDGNWSVDWDAYEKDAG